MDLLDERLIEASMAVEGRYDVIAGIEELRRRQLVDHAARAALHPLVRDHVYAGLAGDTGRRRNLHRLAAAHCEQVLADPLEASWHYARAGEPAEAADLLVASVPELTLSGRCARAADLAAELLGGGQLAEEARRVSCWSPAATCSLDTERAGEAEDSYRDALARPAPPAVRAGVAWRLAQCMLQRGQVPEALDLCRTAAASLSAGDGMLSAHLATVLGQAHLMLSDYDQAAATAPGRLTSRTRSPRSPPSTRPGSGAAPSACSGWWPGCAGSRRRRGGYCGCRWPPRAPPGGETWSAGRCSTWRRSTHEHGELDSAERLYAEALAEMRSIGDGYGTAGVLHSLGKINFHRCAADEAMALFLESVALRRRLGDAQGAANSEHAYALVLLSLGRTAEARELLETVLGTTADLGERRSRGHYLDSLAMIALVDGDVATAERYLAEAGDIAAAIDEPRLRATVARAPRARLPRPRRPGGRPADGGAAGTGRPAGPGGPAPEPDGLPLALERCAVIACVALASGDRATAARQAAEMERRAAANGFTLEARAARRIAAAAAEGGADEASHWCRGGRGRIPAADLGVRRGAGPCPPGQGCQPDAVVTTWSGAASASSAGSGARPAGQDRRDDQWRHRGERREHPGEGTEAPARPVGPDQEGEQHQGDVQAAAASSRCSCLSGSRAGSSSDPGPQAKVGEDGQAEDEDEVEVAVRGEPVGLRADAKEVHAVPGQEQRDQEQKGADPGDPVAVRPAVRVEPEHRTGHLPGVTGRAGGGEPGATAGAGDRLVGDVAAALRAEHGRAPFSDGLSRPVGVSARSANPLAGVHM